MPVLNQVRYTHYEGGDEPAIIACWNRSMPKDQISLGRFVETTLLDANFDGRGLIMARDERDGVCAFVHAVTYRAPSAGGAQGPGGAQDGTRTKDGFLALVAVDPGYRRQGVGRELVRRAESYLHGQGCSRVVVSPYPPAYYFPGVIIGRSPGSTEFFESNGYGRSGDVVAMDISLAGYEVPEEVQKAKHRLEAEGWRFEGAAPELYARLAQLCREFTDDWADVVLTALRYWADPAQVRVATWQDQLAGFAIFGAFHGCADRFGPFGVAAEFRRSGIGNVLLHETLREMAARSLHGAWFLWTGENDSAGRLYQRAGFEVTRRFAIYERSLVADEAQLSGRQAPGHQAPGHQAPGHPAPGHPAPGHPAPGHEAPLPQAAGRRAAGAKS